LKKLFFLVYRVKMLKIPKMKKREKVTTKNDVPSVSIEDQLPDQIVFKIPKKRKSMDSSEDNVAKPEVKRAKLKDEKLELVLDIDHTILHASRNRKAIRKIWSVDREKLLIHDVWVKEKKCYWIKIRKGFLSFLQDISSFYNIHLYTNANQGYAQGISNLIESLCGGQKIIKAMVSRDTNPLFALDKSLIQIGCEPYRSVILDDRIDVWENVGQLIQIPWFKFWPSLKNVDEFAKFPYNRMDESVDEQLFLDLGEALKNVHKDFFDAVSVKKDRVKTADIIFERRSHIFDGLLFSFTGVFTKVAHKSPSETRIWKVAKAMGATCQEKLVDDKGNTVTHLICGRTSTLKWDNARREDGIHVVNLNWFEDSRTHFTRMPEENYLALKPCTTFKNCLRTNWGHLGFGFDGYKKAVTMFDKRLADEDQMKELLKQRSQENTPPPDEVYQYNPSPTLRKRYRSI